MAVGWVQNWTGVTATNPTDAVITGAALTAGNYIVFGVRTNADNTVTITGVDETAVLTQLNTSELHVFIFKAAGGETSFTLTGHSSSIWVTAAEFSGIDPTQATAVFASASVATGAGTTCSTGSADNSLGVADSMAVAFLETQGVTTTQACADASASGGAAYTLGSQAVAGSITMSMAWKATAVAEVEVGTWTWVTGRISASGIIVLKGIAAAGGGTASWSGMDDGYRRRRR